ncbi:MAG: phosphoribosylglycinamide formyltransferase [Elusimicrobiota bacterium]
MKNIAVLASGGGSNLQALIDAVNDGYISDARISCVISNNKKAYALERARINKIKALFLDPKNKTGKEYTQDVIDALKEFEIDLVCLAGFMIILSPEIVKEFDKRILNIHPALLPKYGGKGMYGHHVHEAVISAGEKESGATVHFVDDGCDTGTIIIQEKLDVLENDTPETLAKRVLEIEHKIYPEAVKKVLKNI